MAQYLEVWLGMGMARRTIKDVRFFAREALLSLCRLCPLKVIYTFIRSSELIQSFLRLSMMFKSRDQAKVKSHGEEGENTPVSLLPIASSCHQANFGPSLPSSTHHLPDSFWSKILTRPFEDMDPDYNHERVHSAFATLFKGHVPSDQAKITNFVRNSLPLVHSLRNGPHAISLPEISNILWGLVCDGVFTMKPK